MGPWTHGQTHWALFVFPHAPWPGKETQDQTQQPRFGLTTTEQARIITSVNACCLFPALFGAGQLPTLFVIGCVLHNLAVFLSRTTQATASKPVGMLNWQVLVQRQRLFVRILKFTKVLWSKIIPFTALAKPPSLSLEDHLQIWSVAHHSGHAWTYWALAAWILALVVSSAQCWLLLWIKYY